MSNVINGISQDESPETYAVAEQLHSRLSAWNAKGNMDLEEAVPALVELLGKTLEVVAKVEARSAAQ